MPLDTVMERPETTAPVPRQARTAPFRILVADDQPEVLEAVRLLMSGRDCIIALAKSPEEAIELAASETFDAALIDLNYEQGRTGGERGLDLVTALLDEAPTLPVIVMTAWGSRQLANDAIARGAKDLVEKPWDEERLSSLLRAHAELGRALRRIQELEAGDAPAPVGTDMDIPQLHTMRLHDVEGLLVRHAMTRHQGNVSRAARTLGLSRSALYRRLERHRIL